MNFYVYIFFMVCDFQNSSTLSRLLKTVEDFGVAFVKYLECDNQTANEKTFSFLNISK